MESLTSTVTTWPIKVSSWLQRYHQDVVEEDNKFEYVEDCKFCNLQKTERTGSSDEDSESSVTEAVQITTAKTVNNGVQQIIRNIIKTMDHKNACTAIENADATIDRAGRPLPAKRKRASLH